jgi:hypothetical protein
MMISTGIIFKFKIIKLYTYISLKVKKIADIS